MAILNSPEAAEVAPTLLRLLPAIAEYITVLLLRESLSGGPPLLSALETNSPKLARDAAPALLLAGLTGGCRVVGRTTMASRSLRDELIEEPPEEPPALLMDER